MTGSSGEVFYEKWSSPPTFREDSFMNKTIKHTMTGEVEERICLLAAQRHFYSNLFVFAAGTYCIHRVKVRAQAHVGSTCLKVWPCPACSQSCTLPLAYASNKELISRGNRLDVNEGAEAAFYAKKSFFFFPIKKCNARILYAVIKYVTA